MHQEISRHLEDYLKGEESLRASAPELPAEFSSHLGECQECAQEVRALQAQSQLLRSLRAPRGIESHDIEPRAGFYARVIERIEAQPPSIWSVFLDRRFGLRLAVASAALIALLGTYLVTSEPSGPELASSPAVVFTDPPRATAANLQTEASRQENEGLQQKQQRDAVLVDLASYHQ
jgi:anti-sigma factor RsiW